MIGTVTTLYALGPSSQLPRGPPPQKNADIMDMALKGKVAIVEAVECDFDDHVHLAVVLEDDPGRDLGMLRQPGHRFFFSPEEVEPLALGEGVSHER